MRLKEYISKNGFNPFQSWFNRLNSQAAVKVTIALARLEAGNTSNIKWFSGIGEYRIDWGPGYRIYLAREGSNLIILFGGGTKKKQQSDIKDALRLFNEYKQRKKKR